MIRGHQIEKSVRFDLQDVSLDHDEEEDSGGEGTSTPLRSPPPATPTPSPTYSISTVESSVGPITPPNQPFVTMLDPKDTAYAVPLDSRSAAIPKLAPVLSSAFPLRWDMKENPVNIIKQLPLDGGNDQAGTMPSGEPIRRMLVVHEALMDWPLDIESPNDSERLTVHQVLLKIHEHIVKFVKEDHFKALESKVVRDAITSRYYTRAGQNTKDALRRIDYLPGRVYVGLSVKDGRDGQWEFSLIADP